MNLIKLAIKNYVTVLLVMTVMAIFGMKSYFSFPRETFPDIKVPYVFVNTMYLGVSPKDMESLVTNPIERKLKTLKGIKHISSTSADSMSSIFIEFNPDVDIEQALQKVKDKVDTAVPDLPKDLPSPPNVKEFSFEEFPFIYVVLYGRLDLVQLKTVADDLKKELEKLDGILDVNIIGGQDREIQIIVSPEKMQEKGLAFSDINKAIQGENINIPGGNMDLGASRYSIRVPGEFNSVEDLQTIIVKNDKGTPIYLRDIASIRDGFSDQTSLSRYDGQPNIMISLTKRSGTNLLKLSQLVKDHSAAFNNKRQIKGLKIGFMSDQSKTIKFMLSDLENSIFSGFLLVMLVLFFSLGFRTAFIVALSIPFSLFISFVVFGQLGFTLNMIVLFSLVLVSGMLADDAIVVIENTYRLMEKGVERRKAAFQAAKQVAVPVITSTMTTMASFLPLLFWPGIMGQFMGNMPKTVLITMTSSLVVALLVNPVIAARTMKLEDKVEKTQHQLDNPSLLDRIMEFYHLMLEKSLDHPARTLLLVFALFIFSFFAYKVLGKPPIFFPDITPKQGYVSITMPPGALLEDTDKMALQVEKRMLKYDTIRDFSSNIGGQTGGMSSGQTNPNKAQIVIDFKERGIDVLPPNFDPRETIKQIREELKLIPGATFELTKPEGGPPRGAAISFKITGEDFDQLRLLSDKVQRTLHQIPGLVNIKDDYEEGLSELRVDLDRGKMALIGINTAAAASAIRTAVYGSKVSVFRDKSNNDEYDIVLRYPKESRRSIEDVENIIIPTFKGVNVPLKVFATIRFTEGIGYIQHKEYDRVIEVSSEVEKGENNMLKRKEAMALVKSQITLPEGYAYLKGGEEQSQQEAASFLGSAFLVTVFIIFIILVTQFHSFIIPFIILGTILLSFIGLFWGLILTGTPFCIIMTGVAVITLAGLVVKNGIILLDFLVILRKEGYSKRDACIEASKIRFRPVMLTAIAAILGLLPMSTGISYDFHKWEWVTHSEASEWWASMSNAVIFGLAFATILTLVVVPVAYYLTDEIKTKLWMKWFKRVPTL